MPNIVREITLTCGCVELHFHSPNRAISRHCPPHRRDFLHQEKTAKDQELFSTILEVRRLIQLLVPRGGDCSDAQLLTSLEKKARLERDLSSIAHELQQFDQTPPLPTPVVSK